MLTFAARCLLATAAVASVACARHHAAPMSAAPMSAAPMSAAPMSAAPMPAASMSSMAPIPNGTYVSTITRADAIAGVSTGLADTLSGTWALVMNGTSYTARFNGADVAAGEYHALPEGRIHFPPDTGSMACGVEAVYHIVVTEHQVVYHKVSDECAGRVMVLTAHPWRMTM